MHANLDLLSVLECLLYKCAPSAAENVSICNWNDLSQCALWFHSPFLFFLQHSDISRSYERWRNREEEKIT